MEFNLNRSHQRQRKFGPRVASKLFVSGPNGISMSSLVSLWAAALSNFSSSILPKRSKVKSNCRNRVGAALESARELVIATSCKSYELSSNLKRYYDRKRHNLPCQIVAISIQFNREAQSNEMSKIKIHKKVSVTIDWKFSHWNSYLRTVTPKILSEYTDRK